MPPKKRALAAVNGRQASAPRASVAATRVKADKILELVASGHTITSAGKAMNPPMTEPQASKLYNEALTRAAEANNELRILTLERELETLRLLKKSFMPQALNGDEKAARIILGVVDRVADLMGFTQSIKVQVSNQRIDEVVSTVIDMLDGKDDQVPKLLESGVLVIEQPAPDTEAAG